MRQKKGKQTVEEIDLLDDMLTALVDLLEEKGVLSHEEWEKRIKEKVKERTSLVNYRDLEG